MTQKFTRDQCVRIILTEELNCRYSNDIIQRVKKYKDETGDIVVISSNPSGYVLDHVQSVTEDIYCDVKLHKSKQTIRVPVEALEPC